MQQMAEQIPLINTQAEVHQTPRQLENIWQDRSQPDTDSEFGFGIESPQVCHAIKN